MEKKTKLSFKEFESFRSEQEKGLWKFLLVANVFFLVGSFILMFISEGILKLGVVSWSRFWILVGGNIVIFGLIFLSFIKNFKVWLLKYVLAISGPLLMVGWIYSTNPNYAKPIFIFAATTTGFIAFMFYDTKVLFLSNFVTAILFGLLFFYYLKIGAPITFYEIYLIYMLLFLLLGFSFFSLQRTNFFLVELLQKRKEVEEAKTVLEIKVKARTKELEQLTKTLDQRVRERTGELQERINQLERFGKLTIGRELRMVELKKEIEEKNKEIEKLKKELEGEKK